MIVVCYRLSFLLTRIVLKMAAVNFATMTPEKREGLMRISSHDDKEESSPKRTKYRNAGQAISS